LLLGVDDIRIDHYQLLCSGVSSKIDIAIFGCLGVFVESYVELTVNPFHIFGVIHSYYKVSVIVIDICYGVF